MRKVFFLRTVLFTFTFLYTAEGQSQNVGLGTNAPAGKLHIRGSSAITQLVIDGSATQEQVPLVRLRNSAANDLLQLRTDASNNIFMGLDAGKK